MKNNENKSIWSRREFFRSSSLILGAGFLPFSLLFEKSTLGSSISVPISFGGKTIGIRFTMVNGSYVIGTIGDSKGEKLGHMFIPGPSGKGRSTSGAKTSVEVKGGGSVSVDRQKGIITTSVKGVSIGKVQFENSKNDDIPNAQGFLGWLGDQIADVARAVVAGICWLQGGSGDWMLSGGGTISITGGKLKYKDNAGGFKSEAGLEESPGVWY